MSDAADLLQSTFRPAAAARRWVVTPVCVSVLAHLLILSSLEGRGLLEAGRLDEQIERIFTIETGTIRPEELERAAIVPELAEDDSFAVDEAADLVARMFPDYRDPGPREAPEQRAAPRYPEEELPIVAGRGLSERSQAFVRDGELDVIDPGEARIIYIPAARTVERAEPDIRVAPKLTDRAEDFVRGLPSGEPAFLGRRKTPPPSLDPPPHPEEELPIVAGRGLSERSQAFVRDGELDVIDPGEARIIYIPAARTVERAEPDIRVAPKLTDRAEDFVRGLPSGEPGFLGERKTPPPSLDPPPQWTVSPGFASTTLDRDAEGLFADSGPAAPARPVELDVNIDVYAEPGSKYRFFRMTVTQRKGAPLPVIAKNILFVIDISSSIRLGMLNRIRDAVANSAAGLNRGDRFNVVRFSEQYYKEFDGFVPASVENIRRAARGVRKEPGQVRTDVYTVLKDIIAGLRMKRKDARRPTNIYVISDGNPTTGMQDIRHIVNDLSAVTRTNYSIFAVNPGAPTANAYLLDLLAYRNRGRFVQAKTPGEADATILELLMQHKDPVLVNLRAQYGNFEVDQVYPATPPNLYSRRPIIIYGRCLPGDTIAVRIIGDSAGGRRKFLYTSTLPEVAADDKAIAREWARGKIHYLTSLVAREGEKREYLDEMRRLSARYKLASPFK